MHPAGPDGYSAAMSMEPEVLTVAVAARRAAEIVDPDGDDPLVGEWFDRFEDRAEPITVVEDVEQEVAESTGALDPQAEEPALVVASAILTYLAYRRDAVAQSDDRLLRLAVDAELHDPSEPERMWRADAGLAEPA